MTTVVHPAASLGGRLVANDEFSAVLGDRRGGAVGGGARASLFAEPACPKTGSRVLAALAPRSPGGYWDVGWYGSSWTLMIDLTRDRQALWQEHRRLHGGSFTGSPVRVEPLTLSDQDAYPHLRLRWEALPDDVQERICREVSLGVHPLAGSTNDRPLRPF